MFASCQDEQEAAGIANVNKLISFVNPETEGGAGTSLLLQILYHRHKLKKEIKAKFDKRIADNEAREIQKKKEEEEKLKKKLEELRLKYGDREDSSDSDSSGWSSDEEKKKKQTVEYPKLTYSQILQHMLEACQRNEYNQIPMLTSSRPIDLENDGFDVIPDNFKGTKRALLIGINYTDQPIALTSCHNDCNNAVKYLKNCHDFEEKNVTMLLDDGIHMEPTKKNILTTFQKFAFSCRPGDVVFFHFSGHGTKVEDTSGDESDGFDQAMLPVDYFDHGEVIDDDIFRVLLIPMVSQIVRTLLDMYLSYFKTNCCQH